MYHLIIGYLLPFALLMGVLVGIHEGGHFAAARFLGIGVTEFSIGMGPSVFSRSDRSGCVWKLCILPIGGYVRMLGDQNASSSPDILSPSPEPTEVDAAKMFKFRPPSHRAIVVAAGPIVNFVFGLLILWGVYVVHGQQIMPPIATAVDTGSPAERAGIRVGDRILTIAGVPVRRFEDIIKTVGGRNGLPTDLVVDRDGTDLALTVVPASLGTPGDWANRTGRIGVRSGIPTTLALSPSDAMVEATRDIGFLTTSTVQAVWQMLTLQRSLKEMGGPVKIAQVSGEALSFGWVSYLILMAVLSVNLGVMNLLPIPVLDGSHLVLFAIEGARGKPANPKTISLVFRGGACALMFLFAIITGSDIGILIQHLVSG